LNPSNAFHRIDLRELSFAKWCAFHLFDSSHTRAPFRFSKPLSRFFSPVRSFLPLGHVFLSCLSTREKRWPRRVRPISAYPNLNCVYPHLVHFRYLAKACALVEKTGFGARFLCRRFSRFTTQRSLRWVMVFKPVFWHVFWHAFSAMPKRPFTVPLTPLSLPSIPFRWPSPQAVQIEGCRDCFMPYLP